MRLIVLPPIVMCLMCAVLPVWAADPLNDTRCKVVLLLSPDDYRIVLRGSDFAGCFLRLETKENHPGKRQTEIWLDVGPDPAVAIAHTAVKYEFESVPVGAYTVMFTPDVHPDYNVPLIPAMKVEVAEAGVKYIVCDIPAIFSLELLVRHEAVLNEIVDGVMIAKVVDLDSQRSVENVLLENRGGSWRGKWLVGVVGRTYRISLFKHPLEREFMTVNVKLTPEDVQNGRLLLSPERFSDG